MTYSQSNLRNPKLGLICLVCADNRRRASIFRVKQTRTPLAYQMRHTILEIRGCYIILRVVVIREKVTEYHCVSEFSGLRVARCKHVRDITRRS